MEGEFQDQGQLDQYLEEWLYPRGGQYVHSFFYEQKKQDCIQIENSDPEGALIINQSPQGGTSTMVVIEWSEKVEGYGDNIYSPL